MKLQTTYSGLSGIRTLIVRTPIIRIGFLVQYLYLFLAHVIQIRFISLHSLGLRPTIASPYHSNSKTIVFISLFLLHSKSFADKRRPNRFEDMMASNNTLE